MDKWIRCIKPLVKQSNDDFAEEIEMKPIGRHLNKNYVNLKSVYELSELELLEHPITKAAINRGLVSRVTPIFKKSVSPLQSFQSGEKSLGVSTGVGVDVELQAGSCSRTNGLTTLRPKVDQFTRAEVAVKPETVVEAGTAAVSRKLNQPEVKYHQQKDTVASKTDGLQFFRGWIDKASEVKPARENQWVNFEGRPNLSVTYKINSSAIEDSISLFDRRIEYGGELQRLPVYNRGSS